MSRKKKIQNQKENLNNLPNEMPSPFCPITIPFKIENDKRKEIDKNLSLLNSKIGEFLKTYLIIGYTFDGIPIQIVAAKTQQDLDSLNLALHRFLMLNIHGPANGPEPSEPGDENS